VRRRLLPHHAIFVSVLFCVIVSGNSSIARAGERDGAPSVDTCPRDGNPAVRADDGYTRSVIAYGIRRSATFAGLVAALEATDIVVIVEADPRLSPSLNGYLVFMSSTTACRYVRIRFTTRVSRARAVPIIGHELQHALEVGVHPEVVDADSLRAMYERIGQRSGRENAFESADAERTGRAIGVELFRPAPAGADADK